MEYKSEFEKEILQRLVTIETKLDDFKEISRQTYSNNTNLSVLNESISNINKQVIKNEENIDEIKNKPTRKWESLLATIISTITTIIINMIFINLHLSQ